MPDNSPLFIIHQATEVTEELYQACQRLIPQMTHNNPPPSRRELALILSAGSSFLFIAQRPEPSSTAIIGLATLALYRVPTGLRGIIEDVIVDENARRRGIGEALTRACLDFAQQAGCPQVMLSSNPGRQAANQLYQRMGFKLRKTNVYRYSFDQQAEQE
jgi:ribosomal protein S18 acetylase RimI-like enzyme